MLWVHLRVQKHQILEIRGQGNNQTTEVTQLKLFCLVSACLKLLWAFIFKNIPFLKVLFKPTNVLFSNLEFKTALILKCKIVLHNVPNDHHKVDGYSTYLIIKHSYINHYILTRVNFISTYNQIWTLAIPRESSLLFVPFQVEKQVSISFSFMLFFCRREWFVLVLPCWEEQLPADELEWVPPTSTTASPTSPTSDAGKLSKLAH